MKKLFLLLLLFPFLGMLAKSQICQWAQKIAGTNNDYAYSTTVDGSGNVYIAGGFSSDTLNFNNSISLTNSGSDDAYIAKYNASGTCQWAQKIAGTGNDSAYSIAVDGNENVYVAGVYSSTTLIFNNNISLTSTGSGDAYIAKYNASGICQWAQKISGTNVDEDWSIAIDGSGNVYVAGYFWSGTISFNNGISLTQSDSYDAYDAYIAKYNASGTCQWAQKIAGTSGDFTYSIAVDGSGNVYVAGYFYSTTLIFNNGISLTKTNSVYCDAYIAKYNTSGVCQLAQKIAGTSSDFAWGIAVDENGNVYVTGDFNSTTISFNNGISLTNSGSDDAYIAKYNASGVCQWAQKIAGNGSDYAWGIVVDISGNVYVAGYFYPITISFNNDISLTNSGSIDAYITKYNASGTCQWAQKIAGTNDDYAISIAVDGSGNVYVAGFFNSTNLSFNNGISLTNSDSTDAYIAKYIGITDVKEPKHKEISINIFPNPSNDKIMIEANLDLGLKTELVILNILGEELLHFNKIEGGALDEQIDISNFPAGIYFLKVIQNNKVMVKEFVKY